MKHAAVYCTALLCGLMLLPACLVGAVSPTAPIEIEDINTLQRIGNDPDYPLNGNYLLVRDIDASATQLWNGGAGFLPIGMSAGEEKEDERSFTGTFDGNGYVIRNLFIQRPEEDSVGLFRSLGKAAAVVRLRLEGGAIVGAHYVGPVAGVNWSLEVYACSADVAVSGTSRVGGLIGINRGAVAVAYALGAVQGENFVGGLVGRNYRGSIEECYAAGPVFGIGFVGGLVGNAVDSETIASFWDVDTSGVLRSDGGWGEPSANMIQAQTFKDAGWDFQETWTISRESSYPYFK